VARGVRHCRHRSILPLVGLRPANRPEVHRGQTIENTGLVRRDAGAETTNAAEMRADFAVRAPDLRLRL
jgi:hypothetical protein